MSRYFDSLKRELGKNTGKWVSNKVFGDGHSTPYRVKIQRQKLENDLRKAELKAESKQRRSENNKKLFTKVKQALSDNEKDKELIQNFYSKRDVIIESKIPSDKNDIIDFSNYLLSTIKANGWKSGQNELHINSLSDSCLTKLEQCSIRLKSIGASNEATYLDNEIKQLNNKKLFQKYLVFAVIAVFAIIVFILYKSGVIH